MLGCEDGDVRLTRDNFPQIYWNYEWLNICPFQFADNKYGIDQFCKKVGLYEGGTTKNASKEDEKLYIPMKHYESYGRRIHTLFKKQTVWSGHKKWVVIFSITRNDDIPMT